MIRVEMSDAGVPEGSLESLSFVATDQVVSRRPIAASVGAQQHGTSIGGSSAEKRTSDGGMHYCHVIVMRMCFA